MFRIFCYFAGELPFALCHLGPLPLPPCPVPQSCSRCCCLNFNCVPGAPARRWSTLVQALINYSPRWGWRSRGIVGVAAAACYLEKVNTTNALLAQQSNYPVATTIAITMTALRGRESLLEKPSRWQWQHQQHGREMAALQLPASKDYGQDEGSEGSATVICFVRCGCRFFMFALSARRPEGREAILMSFGIILWVKN